VLQATLGVGFGVQRQGRLVLRKAAAIGIFGLLLLQARTVREQDAAQLERRPGTPDLSGEAVANEQRKIAAVIDVGVREDHPVQRVRIDGQRRPVAQPQLLVALKQSAIDEYLVKAAAQQILGAGNGAGAAEELEIHECALGNVRCPYLAIKFRGRHDSGQELPAVFGACSIH